MKLNNVEIISTATAMDSVKNTPSGLKAHVILSNSEGCRSEVRSQSASHP